MYIRTLLEMENFLVNEKKKKKFQGILSVNNWQNSIITKKEKRKNGKEIQLQWTIWFLKKTCLLK